MTNSQFFERFNPVIDFGFSKIEEKLMYFMVYCGGNSSDLQLNRFAKRYDMTKTTVIKASEKIISVLRGIAFYREFFAFSFRTERFPLEHYFPLAFNLLRSKRKIYEEIQSLKSARERSEDVMWDAVMNIYSGKMSSIDWNKVKQWGGRNHAHYFLYVWKNDVIKEALRRFENVDMVSFVCDVLRCSGDNDNLFEEDFNELADLVSPASYKWTNLQQRQRMSEMIDLYKFVFCGVKPGAGVKYVTEWGCALKAVAALYERDIDASLKYFETSLKVKNKISDLKNVYDTPFLNLYLILAYKMANTDTCRGKIATFLKKKAVEDNSEFASARILAEVFVDIPREDRLADMLGWEIPRARTPLSRGMMTLLTYYLGMEGRDEINGEWLYINPKCALIRHEMSPYVSLTDTEHLDQVIGEPLFGSYKRKKRWENVLEEATAALTKDVSDANAQSSERICYLVNGHYIHINKQVWLKSERWSSPRVLSERAFFDRQLPGMDDVDKDVARTLKYPAAHVRCSEILHCLIGCDRVFCSKDLMPVTVTEDNAFLRVERTSEGFELKTNLYQGNGYGDSVNMVWIYDEHHYSVVKRTKEQEKLLEYMSKVGVFPKEAENPLRAFLLKIGNIIDVRSDLIGDKSGIPQADGNNTIIIRVSPKKTHYLAEVLVRPFEEGRRLFSPGQGDRTYYDENRDGVSFMVVRNLHEEAKRLYDLTDYMENDQDATANDAGHYMLDTGGLLSLMEFVRTQSEKFAIEWPEGKKLNVLGQLSSKQISISLNSKEKWFEMEGEALLSEGNALDISALLSAMSAGLVSGRYVKLNENDYLALSESLAARLKKIESISEISRGHVHVSTFNSGMLASVLNNTDISVSSDGGAEKLERAMAEAAGMMPDIPAGLNASLRDYQEDGFRWMVRLDHWGGGACLADDMGLGKTVQAIAFMLYKASDGPSLVVAPASVVLNWKSEIEKFAPSLNVKILGSSAECPELLASAKPHDIFLVSYRLLTNAKDSIVPVRWNTVCLDEAHAIKNRTTAMSSVAMSLSSSSRIVLTGTPVQNYLGELWNIFQFLNPGLLGSYQKFTEKFINPEGEAGVMRRQQLKRIISPFILRRTKSEVVEELPEKTDIIRRVQLSDSERVFYETLRESAKRTLDSSKKVDVNALAEIMRLRLASCDIALVDKGNHSRSSKTESFMDVISEIVSGNNRVLVFSQFTSYLAIVKNELDAMGMDYFYLDGSVPVAKRAEMVNEFQNGNKMIFLISLKAGGLGLNLTGANYVIHLDPWWNPAIEQQATDRAYRIGQTQNVTVYHLISENTIEEKILRLHRTKRDLADALLEGHGTGHAISLAELKEMLQENTIFES